MGKSFDQIAGEPEERPLLEMRSQVGLVEAGVHGWTKYRS